MKAETLKKSILQYAMEGKLVPQDPNDEPASELLKRIEAEKEQLIKNSKLKKEQVIPKITEEEKTFKIPQGWEWVKLGEIVNISTGKHDANHSTEKGKYAFFTCSYTPMKCDTCTYKGAGIILPGNGANVGLSIYYEGEFDAYQRTYVLQQYIQDFFLKYIHFSLLSNWKEYNANKMYGGATPYIKLGNIQNYIIPLPPLAEQKRIVEKLEKILPLIDEYGKNEELLSKINKNLPQKLRQSILQEAVQGKLVPQNPDDEPASELLKRIKAEKEELIKQKIIKKDKNESFIFRRDNSYYEQRENKELLLDNEMLFEIPENWMWVRLSSVCKKIHYGYTASAENKGNVKLTRITDIQDNFIDWNNVPFCTVNAENLPNYELHNRDILIARTGGTIGKTYIVKDLNCKAVFASYLIRAIPLKEINEDYLKLFMESPLYWNQLKDFSMGTGQPNVNGQSLSSLLLPLPPFKEQVEIVEKVKQLFKSIEKLSR